MMLPTGHLIIAEALTRLAIARGAILDETTTDVYLRQLTAIEPIHDPVLITRACEELGNFERGEMELALPAVGTIRARCESILSRDAAETAAKKLLPFPKSDEDGPTFFCLDCRDETNGWRMFYCPGIGALRVNALPAHYADLTATVCARHNNHGPHVYTEHCACHGRNPVAAERRAKESRPTSPPKPRVGAR